MKNGDVPHYFAMLKKGYVPGTSLFFADALQVRTLEIGLAVARAERPGCVVKAHRAAIEHDERGGELAHIRQDVGGEKDGAAFALQARERLLHGDPAGGVEAAHRLVENVEVALEEQVRGEPELLRHSL